MQGKSVTPAEHLKAAAEAAKILSDLAIAACEGPQALEDALATLSALSKTGARVENDFTR